MENLPISPATLEAVRVLATAGVSDRVLGSVVREILTGKSADTSTATTVPSPALTPAAPRPTTAAPEATAAPRVRAPAISAPTIPTKPVPIKVRFPDGHATNLTIPGNLLAAAAKKMGGDDEARKWIRGLAMQAPADAANRSGWVQEQVAKALS